MRLWLTAGAFAVAFVLAGLFFGSRDSLGDADQYASVGSFLLALVTLGVTAVVALRRREPEDPPAAAGSRITIKGFRSSGNVQIGDGTTATMTNNYYATPPADPERKD
ncbi:hypothetical protein [Actinoplanes sp. CA-252034]|uniref:hypothetical protein n=1 Tax=Actinoplanes sp. CA-252034 TaxID=3239906 RepID=UPI003D98A542